MVFINQYFLEKLKFPYEIIIWLRKICEIVKQGNKCVRTENIKYLNNSTLHPLMNKDEGNRNNMPTNINVVILCKFPMILLTSSYLSIESVYF